ncbi:MAG: hypothetical protein PHC84_06045 [Clostridia bacterium]|nr:hypothetical protein [Clostridia bacterium]
MSLNPFNEKPMKYDQTLMDWKNMYPKAYDKEEVDPYTKLRIILMNGTEYEAVWFSHHFHRHCADMDLRRELAMTRRVEQQQQKKVSCLKPISENIIEQTIGYEHLAVDLTAILAGREKNPEVKMALDFALLEDFDHLYRYADLMDLEYGVHAEKLICNYAEIIPGRPTISEHRYPYDDVKPPQNFKTSEMLTKLNIGIIVAAEQQTMNYYMNQAAFYNTDLGRQLYAEIAMIEEQHVSHYGSLLDPGATMLECLLMHEYTECYLYYSCFEDESCPYTKKLWEQLFLQEVQHLHKAADLLKKYENKEWQQVIPDGMFPLLLKFTNQKEYVRNVLRNTVFLTGKKEGYENVAKLPKNYEFFKYQNLINGNVNDVASHVVIENYIAKTGHDYRYEEKPHPVMELRDRIADNTDVGR